MRWLAVFLEFARKFGPKMEEAWVVLLKIYPLLLELIAIVGGAPPLSMARGGAEVAVTTSEGRELVTVLSKGNPGRERQAKELVAALETLDSRMSAA